MNYCKGRALTCLLLVLLSSGMFSPSLHAQNKVLGELELVSASKVENTSGVWVDGQYVGYLSELKGSKKLLLLPGEHEIDVRQGGYLDFVQTVSGPNFFDRFDRHDPRDALHDLLVLLSLLQVVGGLQPHPYFRRTTKQSGHLQAHDGRQGFAPRQNVVQHLAGHAKSFGRGRHGQADRRQDVFLDNLARMDGRQSVLSLITSSLMVVFKIDIQSVFA
jgi:hypothetical protein